MFADLRQDEKTFCYSIAEGDPRSSPFLAGAGATPNPNLSSRTKTILALFSLYLGVVSVKRNKLSRMQNVSFLNQQSWKKLKLPVNSHLRSFKKYLLFYFPCSCSEYRSSQYK